MKCSDLKSELSLYADDTLDAARRSMVEEHLDICPVCRVELSEIQTIRNDLRSLSRPALSQPLLSSIRLAISETFAPYQSGPTFRLVEDKRGWIETWLMPSTVGTFASVVFAFSLVWAIVSSAPQTSGMIASGTLSRSVGTSASSTYGTSSSSSLISPAEYADMRRAVAGESPSINPQGALVALTKSLVRGKMEDEEVVVVADVFGNGLARIAEVIEPTNDSRAIEELQNALDTDPAYAPFVPATLDKRSQTTRVILKIQNVNVKTYLPALAQHTSTKGKS